MINAESEDFVMHRRLMLTVAMKIGDREENENFTAADEAGEEKVNEITVIDEAAEEEEKKEVIVNQNRYLTKAFSTALVIIAFNSWSWLFENSEVMMLRLLLTYITRATLKSLELKIKLYCDS